MDSLIDLIWVDIDENMYRVARRVRKRLVDNFPRDTGLAAKSFTTTLTNGNKTWLLEGQDYSGFVVYKGTNTNAFEDIVADAIAEFDWGKGK